MSRSRILGQIAAGVVVCLFGGSAAADYLVGAVPRTLSYRGKLEQDGAAVTANALQMVFQMFPDGAACDAGTGPAWEDTLDVSVYGGQFAVVLGEDPGNPVPDALFRGEAIHLAITVAGTRLTGCQAILPTAFTQRSAGDVPIGTVIDWWRPDDTVDVPVGYQICDGAAITDARSPLAGKTAPNLVGKFVRGVATPSEIGDPGGNDDLPDCNVTVDPPAHAVSWTTAAGGTHNHRWSYFTDNENWYTYKADGTSMDNPIMNWDDGLDSGGSGIYPFGHDGGVGTTQYYYTRSEGSHSHDVSGSIDMAAFNTTGTAAGGATDRNIPAYVGLLKLVRIY